MAHRERRHRLGTADGIAEDIRLARALGGLDEATADTLAATLHAVTPVLEDLEAELPRARAMLVEQLEIATVSLLASDSSACAQAAAWSLTILLRNLAPGEKLLIVRRQALRKYQCALSIDGLRKREDVLIDNIANQVIAHLEAEQENSGPRTLRELLVPLRETIEDIADRLETHLQALYRFGNPDPEYRDFAIEDSLFIYADLRTFAMLIKLVCERTKDPSETMFWEVFYAQLLSAGIDYIRRGPIDEPEQPWPDNKTVFMQNLNAREGSDVIQAEWEQYITSCHQTCAYQRWHVLQLMCEPHQIVILLQEAVALIREMERGVSMVEALKERYDIDV